VQIRDADKSKQPKTKGYFYFTTVASIMRLRPAIFLLLLLISVRAHAQVNYEKKMRQELAAHPQQDNERVNILNELGITSLDPKEKSNAPPKRWLYPAKQDMTWEGAWHWRSSPVPAIQWLTAQRQIACCNKPIT